MCKYRKENGVTLIELLIVVSIIGILVSIGVASFNSQRDEAGRIACEANVVALNNSILLFQFKEISNLNTLGQLVPNYLKAIPSCPFGEEYVYDKTGGEVQRHTH